QFSSPTKRYRTGIIMRVLQVAPSLSVQLGGPTEVIVSLSKEYKKLGIISEIATTTHLVELNSNYEVGDLINYNEVDVRFFSAHLTYKEYVVSLDFTRWLWKNIRNYDLIEIHYLFTYTSSISAWFARLFKIPYIVHTMGQLDKWCLKQSYLKKAVYGTLVEKANLNNAAFIHCTAAPEAQDVRDFGAIAPILVSPLGVNPPAPIEDARFIVQEKYGIPKDRSILLFLSRIHPKKQPNLLIEAVAALENYRDVHVVFAGSGETEYESELKRQVQNLGLGDHVSFAGFVTGPAKSELLFAADIFVLPSYSENFGLAIADALAHGVSVITTRGVQIHEDIVKYKAGLVIDNNVDQLISAIETLLGDRKLRQSFSKNAKHLVQERYQWSALALSLKTEFENALCLSDNRSQCPSISNK
ncbi:MAG: glycosyltransferase, partial [Bdellovibrionales bacterium]|nr:glycosyltransferase [Bdellovibrionales bacterium]